MRARVPSACLLLIALATAACERTPVDPLDDSAIAELTGPGGERASSLTLPGLLFSAIRIVHDDQGAAAARDLVRDLARIQHELDAASVVDRPELRRQLREEQLRIVLLVHDSDVVARTIRSVNEEAAALRSRRDALAENGIAAPEAESVLDDLPLLLDRARTATSEIEALDAATRAAARTARMRGALTGAARLPSLDEMLYHASATLDRSGRDHLVAHADELRAAAGQALRSGRRDHAQAAAEAAREAQIRVILAGLGPDAVADVIGWAQQRVTEQQARLETAGAVRDVSRLERMNATAGDMLQRADARLRRGDSTGALDLAAHAVDLLNALESTLTSH